MSITIKQAFAKLAMVTGAAVKNPWFVGRNLNQAFADIAENIVDEGGSEVEVTPIVESGTKIATIKVDDVSTDLFAPSAINYSESEQNTGIKWIDGKDIYQKTLSGTSGSVDTDASLGAIANVDKAVFIYGICDAGDIQQSVPNAGLYVKFQNGAVMVYPASTVYANKTCRVTIRYTKSTT